MGTILESICALEQDKVAKMSFYITDSAGPTPTALAANLDAAEKGSDITATMASGSSLANQMAHLGECNYGRPPVDKTAECDCQAT